jgi:hypothetical protein
MENPAAPLPQLMLHDASTRDSIDPARIAKYWFKDLHAKISQQQFKDLSNIFIDDSWWRDIVGLSWDITTKRGATDISQYLSVQIPKCGFGNLNIIDQGPLQPRLSDVGGLIWIESGFTFQTKIGKGRGIVRLANTGPSQWKAWIVHTNLDELKEFLERSPQEQSSTDDEMKEIQVLIIGAGKYSTAGNYYQRSHTY